VETIASGVLGLLLNPEVLKKAQSESDAVLGSHRLPDFNDYDALPYITAVAKETLRWRTVAPVCEFKLIHLNEPSAYNST
jgi:cytochrome P450